MKKTAIFDRHLFVVIYLIGLIWGKNTAYPAGTPGAAQLKISCTVSWNASSSWSKNFTDAEEPYTMSMDSGEQEGLTGDLTFEYVNGSWEVIDETSGTSASGSGTFKISGKNPVNKSVNYVLKDPSDTKGLVSIRTMDMDEGVAVIRFGKPATTTDSDCFECGLVALYAFADCLSTIDTNQMGSAPEEVYVFFTATNKAFSATGSTNWTRSGTCGSDSVQAKCTVSYTPGQWEAVIIPPADFNTWLPAGNKDPNKPGNSISVNVQLRHKGEKEPATDVVGSFYVTLENVSKQPGYCVNAPSEDEAATDADLKLKEGDNLWLEDEASGYTEEDVSEQTVTIESYDFGSYGRLRVKVDVSDGSSITAHLESDPGKDYLDLPKDDNNNRIADSWEKENGVQELPAKWDEANQPAGQYTKGDGISLYEKYRGFVVKDYHQRLDPNKKHLFIYDPSSMALQTAIDPSGVSFVKALDCEVIFVNADNWTGPGASGSKRRVVNFNSTEDMHAGDQHALHLRFPFASSPTEPADYQAQYRAKFGSNSTENFEGTFGCTYPDFSAGAGKSPKAWLAIEIYGDNIDRYTRAIVEYHTYGLAEFRNYTNTSVSKADRATQLAADYIQDNPTDFEKRYWLDFTRTTAHEIGHGVGIDDLTTPRNVGPKECVIRYFKRDEFAPNPNDRFELGLRGPWPHIYCNSAVGTVPGISCWHQIEISDRPGAPLAPAASGLLAQSHIHPAGLAQKKLPTRTLVSESPALALASSLPWNDLQAGDPLRIEISLSCDAYQQALINALQAGTNVSSDLLHPTVSTNWHKTLYLSMYYYDGKSQWKEVMSGNAWTNYLRPAFLSPGGAGKKPLAHAREWLIPSGTVQLAPGEYTLSASWDGDGMVEQEALPASTFVYAKTIRFMVSTITNDIQRALQEHRLAYQAYTQGDYLKAWQHCQTALQITAARERLLAEGTDKIALNAALKLGDYRSAVAFLQEWDLGGNSESGEYAAGVHKVLAPEIFLNPASARASKAQITVQALPGQNYEVQFSDNLVTWNMLDRRLTQTNRYEVTDSLNLTPSPRYYRVVWLP